MLDLRYDTAARRGDGARIAEAMRDEAYAASVELAREKGPYCRCSMPSSICAAALRLAPAGDAEREIRTHGIRNSHLLSIAPTGTISLAFADNASNGIEPPYSWTYQRKKRMPDGSSRPTTSRTTRGGSTATGRRREKLAAGVRHRDGHLGARSHAHGRGGRAVRRFGDQQDRQRAGGLSVPAFKDLYLEAWQSGPEGHHDPSARTGAGQRAVGRPARSRAAERPRHDRPTAASGSTPRRSPRSRACAGRGGHSCAAGNPSWTYMVESPFGRLRDLRRPSAKAASRTRSRSG